jgi:hypothetical protein
LASLAGQLTDVAAVIVDGGRHGLPPLSAEAD